MHHLLVALFLLPGLHLGAATAPVAQNATVSLVQNSTRTIIVNATDADGDALTYAVVTPPAHGTLTYPYDPVLYGNYLSYTPTPGYIGADSFTFRANDGALTSNLATITLQVQANVAPTAYDEKTFAYQDRSTGGRTLPYANPESQTVTFRIITPPAHGSVTLGGDSPAHFTYTPSPGFTGSDSFTWKANDGLADSNLGTIRLQVRRPDQRGGDVVEILVNQDLYAVLGSEVDRLRADLAAEGYTARVVPWPAGSTVAAVWNHLKAEWDRSDQVLAGVLLIGNLPKPKTGNGYNDLVFWNMRSLDTTFGIQHFDLWVGRIAAEVTTYGSEATLIRRALDANHAYRAGLSRLPHTAYVYADSTASKAKYADTLLEIFPAVRAAVDTSFLNRSDLAIRGADAFAAGGEVFDETSHGSTNSYMGGAFSTGSLMNLIAQQRVAIVESCTTGAHGGIANHQLFTRGGGLIWSVAATDETAAGSYTFAWDAAAFPPATEMRAILARGETWGRAIVHAQPFAARDLTVFHGDLSLPVRVSPANDLPVVTTLTASPASIRPGQSTTLAMTFTDSDAGAADSPHVAFEHRVEWFATGYDYGRTTPTQVTDLTGQTATTCSYTYPTAGSYVVRVEVVDEWQARGWKTVTVTVNTPPVAVADNVTATANESRVISVLANDSDPDGQTLTLDRITAAPAHGTAVIASGAVTYTPALDYTGSDTFTYQIKDSLGGTATATVTVTVAAGTNHPPVAQARTLTVVEDTAATAVTLTASDADNDPLTWRIVANPGHGTLAGTAPNLTYRPAANFFGTDSFSFRVNDGHIDSATATVTITVTPVNDPPTVFAGYDTTGDWTGSFAVSFSEATDPDGDALTLAWSTVSGPGTVVFANPAAVDTTFTVSAPGIYILRLSASDGTTTVSDTVTAAAQVAGNQAPVCSAGPDLLAVVGAPIALAGSASDPEGDALTFAWSVYSGPGTVTFADPADPLTTATFSATGTYNLWLDVADACGMQSYDTVRVVVQAGAATRVIVIKAADSAGALPGLDYRLDGSLTGTPQADGSCRFENLIRTVPHQATIIAVPGGSG